MPTSKSTDLIAYDVESLARAFDILRAAGRYDAFLKECARKGEKILVSKDFAESTKKTLITATTSLERNRELYTEVFKRPPPEATIAVRAPDECPACPRR